VSIRDQLSSLVFCIVFVFLPTWLSTAFSLFTCVKLDGKATPPFQSDAVGAFWVEDMSQLCYKTGGYHMAWAIGLGAPIVLLLCLGLPISVFVFMWFSRKQGRLNHTVFNTHYGFMYRLWRPEVCWWEAVVVVQTIGLVIVATFGFSMGPYFQVRHATMNCAIAALHGNLECVRGRVGTHWLHSNALSATACLADP
jgi:hypothetical protein